MSGFFSHIEELGQHIPQETMIRLRSIIGLETQEEIDDWYEFADLQRDEKVQHWLAHKRANPWVLPSVNKFLSKIASDDWDITPNHTNYVETAHAGRNAETSVGVPLLTAILQAKERDNIRAKEMAQIESDGVMRKRWNGIGEREKHAAQRKGWKMRKAYQRDDALMSYDSLIVERDGGDADNRASLERQSDLEAQIKVLKAEIALDKHRTDLPAQVADLRQDIDEEKALRRQWGVRRKEITGQIDALKKGKLAGVRVNGRRPTTAATAQSGDVMASSSPAPQDSDSDGMLANPDTIFNTQDVMLDVLNADESVTTPGVEPSAGASLQPGFYEGPGSVATTTLLPIAENLIPNFDLPTGLGLYSADDSIHLPEFDLVAFDEFLAAIPIGMPPIDPVMHNDVGEQNHGFEYGHDDSSSSTGLRLSQELPRLPPPPATPSPSRDGFEDSLFDAIDGDSHDTTAPRDIDLELNERNIVSGKRRRTQSTRLVDAATARPKKKGTWQRFGAHNLRTEFGFSTTHGMFFSMGGFVTSDKHPITTWGQLQDRHLGSELQKAIRNIDEEDIKDRSKGDAFSKGVALLQGSWFILQCLARVHQRLVVTQLEVATLAFAVVNIFIWSLWWNKPLDVQRPIVVGPPTQPDAENITVPVQLSRLERFGSAIFGRYEDEYKPLSSVSVPSFWSIELDQSSDYGAGILLTLVGTLFGAIHCAHGTRFSLRLPKCGSGEHPHWLSSQSLVPRPRVIAAPPPDHGNATWIRAHLLPTLHAARAACVDLASTAASASVAALAGAFAGGKLPASLDGTYRPPPTSPAPHAAHGALDFRAEMRF
ncbi:hypothetical protein MSAN_00625800 [Mycena sanguinolenta]|uniref:Uncharacterized protein n=1 Tax=Mycena sanguinolenta TaxID=230812 RepID=A0A8H6YZL5_9AGAR|nr:hypothetical protein MSAN_00625800 [Mycena sanguinolenta]